MQPDLLYLASPYSHPDASVREARFQAAARAAAWLFQRGHMVFSPIAHAHPIALHGGLALGWQHWGRFDSLMLEKCNVLFVLTLDGWRESAGIAAEIAEAERLRMPVRYMVPAGAAGYRITSLRSEVG